MMNLTQDAFNSSNSMLRTQPPTQNPNDQVVAAIIYIFSLMCANNIVCSSIFRSIFALVIEAASVFFATIPVANAIERRESKASENFAKVSMFAAWLGGNVAGYYAAKGVYNHDLPYPESADSAETFEAVSDGLFGGAVVSAVYSGAAACLYTIAPITNTYNFVKRQCNKLPGSRDGYQRLDDEECCPDPISICCPPKPGRGK